MTAKPKAPGKDWLSRIIKEPGSESFRISFAVKITVKVISYVNISTTLITGVAHIKRKKCAFV